MAQKFLQISSIHAEAYACAEFRHGPLSMIDDEERTPGKLFDPDIYVVVFIVLDDEHKSQIISNIHQVKERGATTIILTNITDIGSLIDTEKLDYVVNIPSSKNEVLAALQAIIPLQVICYLTAIEKGFDPDKQLFQAIDFAKSMDC